MQDLPNGERHISESLSVCNPLVPNLQPFWFLCGLWTPAVSIGSIDLSSGNSCDLLQPYVTNASVSHSIPPVFNQACGMSTIPNHHCL